MGKMRFIGDVHGHIPEYLQAINGVERSIQVGDFGVGFVPFPFEVDPKAHRNLRGNHDDPALCETIPNWIPDGTVYGNMMVVGGATSIDKAWRTPYHDWWPDEDLSFTQVNTILDLYEQVKPRIIVSHEAPQRVADKICQWYNKRKFHDPSVVRMLLDEMWSIHKPELHIFGHWHHDIVELVEGVRVICLNELSYVDLELDDETVVAFDDACLCGGNACICEAYTT